MKSFKTLIGTIVIGLGLSVLAYGQEADNAEDAVNSLSDEQLAQRFARLDTDGDGVLSLQEFQQMRAMMQPRGERMGQMSPEQREQMRERMQNMSPEQRQRMREQMHQRRGQGDVGHNHEAQ